MVLRKNIHKYEICYFYFLLLTSVIEEGMAFQYVETPPSSSLTVLKNYFTHVMQCRIVLR